MESGCTQVTSDRPDLELFIGAFDGAEEDETVSVPAQTEARSRAPRWLGQVENALSVPRVRFAVLGVMSLTIFLVYSQTLLFTFVYDDIGQMVQNDLVHSWSHWKDYFHMHVWAHQFAPGNYYRPFFLLLLLMEYSIFKLHPLGWHFVSILFHVGATLAVYWLATKFTSTRSGPFVAALLFGIEPIHVESVAWISGVTDPLLAIFAIPSIICYINFRTWARHNGRWLTASILLFACALLSKETAVIVPPILVLYEWFFGSGEEEKEPGRVTGFVNRLRPMLLFALIGAGYVWVRFKVLHVFSRGVTPLPPHAVVYTSPRALLFYAGHLLWPFNLSPFYDIPYSYQPDFRTFVLPAIAVCFLIIVVVTIAWIRASAPVRFFLWWLILPLLPVLNFGMFGFGEVVHDRYLYLPSIGLVMILALGWETAYSWLAPKTGVFCACALVALLSAATIRESLPWANNLVLFYRGVQRSPKLNIARNCLANELFERKMYAQAIAEYQIDLENNPYYFFSDYNLAYAYMKLGKFADAEEFFRRATDVNSANADAWVNLGLTRLYQHKLDLAEPAILTGLQMNPFGPAYHSALGDLRYEEGDYRAALDAYQTEARLHPDQSYAGAKVAELMALQPKVAN